MRRIALVSGLALILSGATISPATAVGPCDVPTLINGSFEDYTKDTAPYADHEDFSTVGAWMNDWGYPKQFLFLDLDEAPQALPGWETTNTDNLVELQRQVRGYEQDGTSNDGGYFDSLAIQPARGAVWAELNATQDAAIYQDVTLTSGTEYTWSIKHHGRVFDVDGTDEMLVKIGPVGGSLAVQNSIRAYLPINDDLFSGAPVYSDDFDSGSQIRGSLEDGWIMYRGTFTPESTGEYRFLFQSVDGWNLTVGNLLDDIEFAPTECVSDPTALPPAPESSSDELAPTGASDINAVVLVGFTTLLAAVFLRRRRSGTTAR